MALKETLRSARILLNDRQIEDASLESELLLRQALGISRVELYTNLDITLDSRQEEVFWNMVSRRIEGEPLSYITGHREFYGLDFIVTPDVLIPRPETELLVEKALAVAGDYNAPVIADIGTGSGCIAVSLAVNLPHAQIFASDISRRALKIAYANCRKQGVQDNIDLVHGDLVRPLAGRFDIIVANLPYVKSSDIPSPCPEPRRALDGGEDGLDQVRRLLRQAPGKLNPKGHLLLEIGTGQSRETARLARTSFPSARVEIMPDFAGIDRVISVAL